MSRYIIVRENGENIPIKAKKILRIEGDGNYVNIYLKNGKAYKNQVGSIGLWNGRLKKSGSFVKANRSHLVNYKCIVSFSRAGGALLRLCSAKEYRAIISQPASPAKEEAIRKNTFRLDLSPDGFIDLMFRFQNISSSESNEEGSQFAAAV